LGGNVLGGKNGDSLMAEALSTITTLWTRKKENGLKQKSLKKNRDLKITEPGRLGKTRRNGEETEVKERVTHITQFRGEKKGVLQRKNGTNFSKEGRGGFKEGRNGFIWKKPTTLSEVGVGDGWEKQRLSTIQREVNQMRTK